MQWQYQTVLKEIVYLYVHMRNLTVWRKTTDLKLNVFCDCIRFSISLQMLYYHMTPLLLSG